MADGGGGSEGAGTAQVAGNSSSSSSECATPPARTACSSTTRCQIVAAQLPSPGNVCTADQSPSSEARHRTGVPSMLAMVHSYRFMKSIRSRMGTPDLLKRAAEAKKATLDALRCESLQVQYQRIQAEGRSKRTQIMKLLVGVLLYIFAGGLAFSRSQGWPFSKAVYFAVVTLSTVGYGDVVPDSWEGKLATVAYGLLGILSITSGLLKLVSIMTALAEANLKLELLIDKVTHAKPMHAQIKLGLWWLCWLTVQLIASAIYVDIADDGSVSYARALWHTFTTSMTIGYDDIKLSLPSMLAHHRDLSQTLTLTPTADMATSR